MEGQSVVVGVSRGVVVDSIVVVEVFDSVVVCVCIVQSYTCKYSNQCLKALVCEKLCVECFRNHYDHISILTVSGGADVWKLVDDVVG